jgi:release factor glutamine methyltransferase
MLTLKAAMEEAEVSIDRVDARVLATHLLGVNSAYLAANPMRFLTEGEDARYSMMVAQRAMGQPVAYLTGKREFYSREFEVGPNVLIPRPETETLVEAALGVIDARQDEGRALQVLDLGTGSGAIAVTLACERPGIAVTATDISFAALGVAEANARAHGARVEMHHGQWYAPLGGRRYDLVVANPPYIAARDPHLDQGDLRFEPRLALTDESDDGLDSIRDIVVRAPTHLAPGGTLLLEHGYDQAEAVATLLAEAGLQSLVRIADLAGIARVAGGTLVK